MALSTENLTQQIRDIKATLRREAGDYKKRFLALHEKMEREVERIQKAEQSGSAIPEIEFADIKNNGFSTEESNAIKQAGCAVIRNTLPRDQVEARNEELSEYIISNGYYDTPSTVEDNYFSQLKSDKPQIFGIYWSKAQVWARQHPNMAEARRYLNRLWLYRNGDTLYFDPDHEVSYADRIRRREPGDASLGLSPHVDAGSIERWLEPNYRSVYHQIFSGDWQSYQAFDGANRPHVEEFPSPAVCSVFRTFQGWVALTAQGPGDGTLQVVPSTLAIPYMLLRAIQDDVPDDDLCGAQPGRALTVSPDWHPLLLEGLVSIPQMYPGDTVWWHPDTIHAVEDKHNGTGYSNVMFIGAAPSCDKNWQFAGRQKQAFLKGESCPDFAAEHFEINYKERATVDDLTPLGRKQMGFD